MIAKGQGEFARQLRLNAGCCPVHGLGMGQRTGWFTIGAEHFTIVNCPRKDCDGFFKVLHSDGPAAYAAYPIDRALADRLIAEWNVEKKEMLNDAR